MEEGRLKQRLVGAIVLVALGVIFIPMLLSGGRDMEMPVFGSNVPERTKEILNVPQIEQDDVFSFSLKSNASSSVNSNRSL